MNTRTINPDLPRRPESPRSGARGLRLLVSTALIIVIVGIGGCGPGKPDVDPVKYEQEIREWHKTRLAKLTTETGWLTLAGLGWLKQGENTIGSDSSNAVVTPPGKAPALLGTIVLKGDTMRFKAAKGVEVTHDGQPVGEIALLPDDAPAPTELRHATLLFYVIKRGDQLGVRVKDSQNPARLNFKGLEYFPIDLKYRIVAKFHPYNPIRILEIPSAAGTVEKQISPGALGFSLNGNEYRIDAFIEAGSESRLFIMFADGTSGRETYGPGRQLYTDLPDSTNSVVLDFNRAYNWPCVFTEFATCPIPPRQNTLADRIEAGEKMYHGNLH